MQDLDQTPPDWPSRRIPIPRREALPVVGIVLAVYLAITCYFQFLVRQSGAIWFPPSAWLPRATNGVINGTLVSTATIQLVLIAGLLIGFRRIRPQEIGLDPKRLPAALGLTVLVWAATQVVLLTVLAFTGQEITVNPQWTGTSSPQATGNWLGQLFGNTPLEEVLFRGFLLPQCLLLTLSWMPRARPGMQIIVALVLSQALFALTHVFFNWYQPQGQWLLLAQFAGGLLFAGVYLRTGNLFLAMGLHTLLNNPSPFLKEQFAGPGLGGAIVGIGILVWVIFGPAIVNAARRFVSRSNKPLKLTAAASSVSARDQSP